MANCGENCALVLHGVEDLRLEKVEMPVVGPGQVKIAVKKVSPGLRKGAIWSTIQVGICMSDVHFWLHGNIGNFVVKAPMIMGHESSGVVVEVGEGVKNLKAGDPIAIEPGIPCRRCIFCKKGRYNLCPDMKFCATPPVHGSLATYFVHDADFCYKLPSHVSLEEGALLEPLSVAVHAITRSGVKAGDILVICGAGPIGLVNVLVAKAFGVAKVIVTDINESRLDTALKLGADAKLNVTNMSPEVAGRKICELLESETGADAAIECSGSEPGARTAVFSTGPGGTVVLVGMGNPDFSMPMLDAEIREVDIRGVFRYVNAYPKALSLVASGKINLRPLITHRFKMTEAVEAYNAVRSGDGVIKVLIDCEAE